MAASGRVAGSLAAPRVRIDEGAQIEARVQMGEVGGALAAPDPDGEAVPEPETSGK